VDEITPSWFNADGVAVMSKTTDLQRDNYLMLGLCGILSSSGLTDPVWFTQFSENKMGMLGTCEYAKFLSCFFEHAHEFGATNMREKQQMMTWKEDHDKMLLMLKFAHDKVRVQRSKADLNDLAEYLKASSPEMIAAVGIHQKLWTIPSADEEDFDEDDEDVDEELDDDSGDEEGHVSSSKDKQVKGGNKRGGKRDASDDEQMGHEPRPGEKKRKSRSRKTKPSASPATPPKV
jgi:hypothetical protein